MPNIFTVGLAVEIKRHTMERQVKGIENRIEALVFSLLLGLAMLSYI